MLSDLNSMVAFLEQPDGRGVGGTLVGGVGLGARPGKAVELIGRMAGREEGRQEGARAQGRKKRPREHRGRRRTL